MNRPDRAPGVALVTDYPSYPAVPINPRSIPTDAHEMIEIPPPYDVLLEREYAGLRVAVRYERRSKTLDLFVQEGLDEPQIVSIPRDKALDAFDHPYCYLQSTDETLVQDIRLAGL